MQKTNKLIHYLNIILKAIWYLNLMLAGGMLGFQVLNILRPEKMIMAGYLGKFKIIIEQAGKFTLAGGEKLPVYLENMSGSPQIAINSGLNVVYILIFTLVAVGINLFYNYHFWKLVEAMDNAFKEGTPFAEKISGYFKKLAGFSLAVFGVGSLLSIAKIIFIQDIKLPQVIVVPVYDNFLLNFLWAGLALFIINGIYKAGVALKKENDLTI